MIESSLAEEDRELLLEVALDAVRAAAEGREFDYRASKEFAEQASFVTLYVEGRLKGCLGSLTPSQDLGRDIAWNAYSAATKDPRFDPVALDDLAALAIHISILSPLVDLEVGNYEDLAVTIRPGDGLLIRSTRARATFLPSVWDKLSGVDDFLTRLWFKARLRQRDWPDDMRAFRYRTLVITSD